MRIDFQVIANTIIQQIPSVILKIKNNRYIFNISQELLRHSRRHYLNFGTGMNMFFTKYNGETMSGVIPFLLELN